MKKPNCIVLFITSTFHLISIMYIIIYLFATDDDKKLKKRTFSSRWVGREQCAGKFFGTPPPIYVQSSDLAGPANFVNDLTWTIPPRLSRPPVSLGKPKTHFLSDYLIFTTLYCTTAIKPRMRWPPCPKYPIFSTKIWTKIYAVSLNGTLSKPTNASF